jgi:hypothetical protein
MTSASQLSRRAFPAFGGHAELVVAGEGQLAIEQRFDNVRAAVAAG